MNFQLYLLFHSIPSQFNPIHAIKRISILMYGIPVAFKLYRMETLGQIHNIYFAHHNYMFRLT